LSARIPNQFHFVFGLKDPPDAFHLIHYLCIASCVEVMRPERIFFHCARLPKGRYWDLVRPYVQVEHIEHVPLVSGFSHDREIKPYV
jgi:hypothetical protein